MKTKQMGTLEGFPKVERKRETITEKEIENIKRVFY